MLDKYFKIPKEYQSLFPISIDNMRVECIEDINGNKYVPEKCLNWTDFLNKFNKNIQRKKELTPLYNYLINSKSVEIEFKKQFIKSTINVKAYKYTTEDKAKAAAKLCNNYFLNNHTTKNLVRYEKELNKSNFMPSFVYTLINKKFFFYIIHDNSLNVVLGEPTEIKIISEDII